MRAILYARVSRGNWEERARRLMNQLQECRATASKNGWSVVAELAENECNSSGASMDLNQLEEMMDMAALGRFDVLVVTEIDRLSRRMAKQILIEHELSRYGIGIEYVNRDFPETSDGQLDKYIRSVIAEYEQVKSVERLARGQRSAVKAGNIQNCNQPPYGYFLKEDNGLRKLAIVEDEAEIVRLIYKWYLRGESNSKHLGAPQIARKLSKLRIPTPMYNRGARRKAGRQEYKHWSTRTIARILASETYIGTWYYGKSRTDKFGKRSKSDKSRMIGVRVPAIIDADTWARVSEKRFKYKNTAICKYYYLLEHRLQCFHCHRKSSSNLNSNKQVNENFHSFCGNAYRKSSTCENKAYYQSKQLEIEVFDWIYTQFGVTSSRKIQRKVQEDFLLREQEDIDDISLLIKIQVSQKERLATLLPADYITAESRLVRKQHIDIAIAALEKEKTQLRSRLRFVESRMPGEIDTTDFSYVYPKVPNIEYLTRRRIIEHLDVRGYLGLIDGIKIAHITSALGAVTFYLPKRMCKKYGQSVQSIDLSSLGYEVTSTGDLEKIQK